MTIEQQVLEKLRDLPREKQEEVLDFVDFLKEKNGQKNPPQEPARALEGSQHTHYGRGYRRGPPRSVGQLSPRH
jgi:hypothetical protein